MSFGGKKTAQWQRSNDNCDLRRPFLSHSSRELGRNFDGVPQQESEHVIIGLGFEGLLSALSNQSFGVDGHPRAGGDPVFHALDSRLCGNDKPRFYL